MNRGDASTTSRSDGVAQFERVDSLRSPKLTAVVADMLRRRIVSGELVEGDKLPPEPELMQQLGISRPTLREALRVLESESLIRPRRGSRTGAEVCAPSVAQSARYMGFVLQYEGVTIADVLEARKIVEPPLAGLITVSKNKTAVKVLKKALAEEEAALDDRVAFGEASIRFHETVAELAGVKSMLICVKQFNWVLGRLTRDVESHPREQTGNARAHKAHQRFVGIVETGDAEVAEKYWRSHVDEMARWLQRDRGSEKVIDLFQGAYGET